ncbi:NAD(P)H-binding protein [Streptomonospora sp. S1-112]|uniref:NAD(P)H-binding protein n=1 Tax=Streptomonospora mangrovi TaxID=2883123 RepID=A0A9X3NQI1_9ACTN|nr:NAD(P)H-binding protein [Streptomonospora mangrovi]MDA0568042.1 NAD(P)H-binding protein [Streptomonospora mangrovi]
MTRVLVTGATGRLGAAVLPVLAGAGLEVRAASRRPHPGGADAGPAGAARPGGGAAAVEGRPAAAAEERLPAAQGRGPEWVVADLATGAGLAAAVAGADTVVHLASAPYQGRYTERVDVDGTRLLLEAARGAGVGHVLHLSIIGVDRVPWGYFRAKLRAEREVRAAGLPWTILRAAQFHGLVDEALSAMARLPVMAVDRGVTTQPVDVADVAERVLALLRAGPSRAVEEFAGPEVLAMDEAVRQWQRARGVRRPVLPLRLPGAPGRAFRAGHLTTAARPAGTVAFADYLARTPRR